MFRSSRKQRPKPHGRFAVVRRTSQSATSAFSSTRLPWYRSHVSLIATVAQAWVPVAPTRPSDDDSGIGISIGMGRPSADDSARSPTSQAPRSVRPMRWAGRRPDGLGAAAPHTRGAQGSESVMSSPMTRTATFSASGRTATRCRRGRDVAGHQHRMHRFDPDRHDDSTWYVHSRAERSNCTIVIVASAWSSSSNREKSSADVTGRLAHLATASDRGRRRA
jgi:hypothetical protein